MKNSIFSTTAGQNLLNSLGIAPKIEKEPTTTAHKETSPETNILINKSDNLVDTPKESQEEPTTIVCIKKNWQNQRSGNTKIKLKNG